MTTIFDELVSVIEALPEGTNIAVGNFHSKIDNTYCPISHLLLKKFTENKVLTYLGELDYAGLSDIEALDAEMARIEKDFDFTSFDLKCHALFNPKWPHGCDPKFVSKEQAIQAIRAVENIRKEFDKELETQSGPT